MADYSQSIDFSAKDALATGDPNKVAQGADIDTELDLISTAIASKTDESREGAANGVATLDGSTLIPVAQLPAATTTAVGVLEIATNAEATTGTATDKWLTPANLQAVLDQNAGIAEKTTTLTDPGADRILFWDDSATGSELAFLTVGGGLEITGGTNLNIDETTIDHDALSNFVADEHIAHSGVTLTAGAGMTGGGTIAASRTFDVVGGTGITANADDIEIDQTAALTWTSNTEFSDQVTFSDTWLVTATLDDTFAAQQDDYAPTGNATASVWRLTPTGAQNISGIAGGVAGRRIHIVNLGASSITLQDESASSTAANRIRTSGAGLAITEQGGCELWYDGTSSRWRIVSNP